MVTCIVSSHLFDAKNTVIEDLDKYTMVFYSVGSGLKERLNFRELVWLDRTILTPAENLSSCQRKNP